MGKQSSFHPLCTKYVPFGIVLSLLLSLLPYSASLAQTSVVSALTVPLILPSAIAFDSAGDLYFAETGDNVIRKVDAVGNITVVVGTGAQGFSGDGGPATAATLDSPQGLALDAASNLYIADTHNHRIRKIDLTTGVITTIAGSISGFSGDGNSAISAKLSLPTALAADKSGNLYLADSGNHRIRRIDAITSINTTVAGTGIQGFSGDAGSATLASIDSPYGIALDSTGNLYLADTHNHRIRKIAVSTGVITTISGTSSLGFSGDTASASTATLALPHGLTIDATGNLYLADMANHRIRRIDATTGIITTVIGDGVQDFAGDKGPPTAASLDSPTATALSPASLLTVSDTGNQRIRQVVAQTNSNIITTIAGRGTPVSDDLILTAPTGIVYGTGQVIASLATSPATGTITFFDNTSSTPTTLGSTVLVSNAATLSIATASAGVHNITAVYSGDQTHLPTQSSALTLVISRQPLIVTTASISRMYGQTIPTISGSVTGVLPQDASNLSVTFTTTATSDSSVGNYPITAILNGPAAGNYTVTAISNELTITPASSVITLSDLVTNGTNGSTVALTAHVASSTIGTPTGAITLLDGNSPLFTTALSSSGDVVFLTSVLAQGSHTFTAVYDGSTNFKPSLSASQIVTIGTGSSGTSPDFALSATGTILQTIVSGSSASFTFSVQTQNNLSSPITLAAVGLPNLATVSFNPATLPPGTTPNTFTMTIATPKTTAANFLPTSFFFDSWLAATFFFYPFTGLAYSRRRNTPAVKLVTFTFASVMLILTSGCGDRIKTDPLLNSSSKTYTITVTGTATSSTGSPLLHSATVTLILQSAS